MRRSRRTGCHMTKNITTGMSINKQLTMQGFQSGIASRAKNDASLTINPEPLVWPSEPCMPRQPAPACQPDACEHRKNHGGPLIPPNIVGPIMPYGHGSKNITAPDRARRVIAFFKKLPYVGCEEKRFGVGRDPVIDTGSGGPDPAFGWGAGEQDHELLMMPRRGRRRGGRPH